MSVPELVLIALSLSLDAVAVSVTIGAVKGCTLRSVALAAAFFGISQGAMPVLGWLTGFGFRAVAESYGPAVGFVLLLLVGGKMLYEAFKDEDADAEPKDILRMRTLTALALATSIDALVVGITFNFVPVSVPLAVFVIGGITAVMAALGVLLGARSAGFFGNRMEALGGAIIILLAFKTLLS